MTWHVECWCEDHENINDVLLWSETYKSLKKAQAACEEDVSKKMGEYYGMDQGWLLEGDSYWNSSSNLVYIIRRDQ